MSDSVKRNSLLHYFRKEGERKRKDASKDPERETGVSEVSEITSKKTQTEVSEPQQHSRMRKFQSVTGQPWLNYSEDTKCMTCSYCIDYNTGLGREEHSALALKEGCTTFQIETRRKDEECVVHKLAVKENLLRNQKPEEWPMESCILRMTKDNFEKISKLFKTAYYIAQPKGLSLIYVDFVTLWNQ